MAAYIDQQGATQQVTLDPSIDRDAKASNLSVEALINQRHPVRAGERSAFEQLCASEGMFIGRNSAFGIRPATMESILNGPSELLYHCDSATGAVWAYDVTADRAVKDRRVFGRLPEGWPDGMAVDAEGGVWVAVVRFGEVVRF